MHDRQFGVEIECIVPETRRIFLGKLCKKLPNIKLSDQVDILAKNDYSNWKIVPDLSVEPLTKSEADFISAEIVSPPLKGEEGLREVDQVLTALRELGAKINISCGLHVHVDARDFDAQDLHAIATRYTTFHDEISSWMTSNRATSKWCRKWSAESLSAFLSGQQAIERYMALNIQAFELHGTVEFRHHHGCLDSERVLAWIEFCVSFVEATRKKVHSKNTKWLTSPLQREMQFSAIFTSLILELKKLAEGKQNPKVPLDIPYCVGIEWRNIFSAIKIAIGINDLLWLTIIYLNPSSTRFIWFTSAVDRSSENIKHLAHKTIELLLNSHKKIWKRLQRIYPPVGKHGYVLDSAPLPEGIDSIVLAKLMPKKVAPVA